MLVVSGCPRSGTSLMMDCLRRALGQDRILGSEFPQERELERTSDESDAEFEARSYLYKRMKQKNEEQAEQTRDMNPNGFWECRYTVQGITWHLHMPKLEGKVCKIVSQGLVRSDPKYIDRIVFMLRHPRQVAKSQERLRRLPMMSPEQEKALVVHSPEMFVQVSMQASLWLVENSSVPVLIVDFDDLLANPEATLESVRQFVGEGDFSTHPVEKKLKRSHPESHESHLWPHAEAVYALLGRKDFKGVVDYVKAHMAEINRDNIRTLCTRLNTVMIYNECRNCQAAGNDGLRKNLIGLAEKAKIDWKAEPCMFDCLTKPFESHLSIEDSVKNNHWLAVRRETCLSSTASS